MADARRCQVPGHESIFEAGSFQHSKVAIEQVLSLDEKRLLLRGLRQRIATCTVLG